MTNPYVPLLIMAAVALAVAVGGLGASAILGPKQKNRVMAQNFRYRGRLPLPVGRNVQSTGLVRVVFNPLIPRVDHRSIHLRTAPQGPGLDLRRDNHGS